MIIEFYNSHEDYDAFSNVIGMLPIKIIIGDEHYKATSTEAAFQASKHMVPNQGKTDYNHATMIMGSVAGGGQQRMGGYHPLWVNATSQPTEKNPDPNTLYNEPNDHNYYLDGIQLAMKDRLMYDLIKMKVTQHIGVMKLLLSTGTSQIIENTAKASYDDYYWGNGKLKTGRNALGNLWMMLRQEINDIFSNNQSIPVMVGLSEGVCKAFGTTKSTIVYDYSKNITKAMVDAVPNLPNGQVAKKVSELCTVAGALNSWGTLGQDIDAALALIKVGQVQTPMASQLIAQHQDPNSELAKSLTENFPLLNVTHSVNLTTRTLTLTIDPSQDISEIIGSLQHYQIQHIVNGKSIELNEAEAGKWLKYAFLKVQGDIFALPTARATTTTTTTATAGTTMSTTTTVATPLPAFPSTTSYASLPIYPPMGALPLYPPQTYSALPAFPAPQAMPGYFTGYSSQLPGSCGYNPYIVPTSQPQYNYSSQAQPFQTYYCVPQQQQYQQPLQYQNNTYAQQIPQQNIQTYNISISADPGLMHYYQLLNDKIRP